jgi:hypothetical protein
MTTAGLAAELKKAALVRKADPLAVTRLATQEGAPAGLTAPAEVDRVHPDGKSAAVSTLGSSSLCWAGVSDGAGALVVVVAGRAVVVVADDDDPPHPAKSPPATATTPATAHDPYRRLIGPAASSARWLRPPPR